MTRGVGCARDLTVIGLPMTHLAPANRKGRSPMGPGALAGARIRRGGDPRSVGGASQARPLLRAEQQRPAIMSEVGAGADYPHGEKRLDPEAARRRDPCPGADRPVVLFCASLHRPHPGRLAPAPQPATGDVARPFCGRAALCANAPYASAGSILRLASMSPRTEATDLSNIACSSALSLISSTFSTPPAPITTGTPTYRPLTPYSPER